VLAMDSNCIAVLIDRSGQLISFFKTNEGVLVLGGFAAIKVSILYLLRHGLYEARELAVAICITIASAMLVLADLNYKEIRQLTACNSNSNYAVSQNSTWVNVSRK